MKKTDFFIIGAPKCGTTTLAYWLGQLDNISITTPKEPHTFADELVQKMPRPSYDEMINTLPQKNIVGDASTWYLWSSSAVDNILRYNPNAKFIVCLRNPVDMFFSYHNHVYFGGNETISDPEMAWNAQEQRIQGYQLSPFQKNPIKLIYKQTCSIGTQVEQMLTKVERQNIHFLSLEMMKSDPENVVKSVLSFLGTPWPTDFSLENSAQNIAKTHAHPRLFWLRQWSIFFKQRSQSEFVRKIAHKIETKVEKKAKLKKTGYKTQIDHDFQVRLDKIFEEEVNKLHQYTKINFNRKDKNP